MKLANLANGKQIAFDDAMPDEHIDDVVGQLVGNTHHDQKLDMLGNIVTQLAKQAESTHHGDVAIVQALNGIANSMGMLAQMIAPIQASLEMSRMATEANTALIAEKLDGIAAAYSAPKELVLDKDKKPIGMKIKAH